MQGLHIGYLFIVAPDIAIIQQIGSDVHTKKGQPKLPLKFAA